MSRQAVYPWATLEKVGDYFIVTEAMRPSAHYFMNATVAQRNKHMAGKIKYCCIKTSYGCIVMVAQVADHIPPYDYEVIPGLFAVANRFDHTATQPLGNKPQARELTQAEKVARMTFDVRNANLPWWWDNGKFLWNGNIKKKRSEDVDAFVNKNMAHFGNANTPYPEFYNLDENLIRRVEEVVDDEEEEDWGPDPIFTDEEQESGGDDT